MDDLRFHLAQQVFLDIEPADGAEQARLADRDRVPFTAIDGDQIGPAAGRPGRLQEPVRRGPEPMLAAAGLRAGRSLPPTLRHAVSPLRYQIRTSRPFIG